MPSLNQQYIADQLNISRATVSRCFTNHPGINPTTRAKVFQLASQLGYQHMEMRVPTKPKGTKITKIGVLVCTDIEEFFRTDYESPGEEIYAGICEYAQLHNFKLDLRYVDPSDISIESAGYREIDGLKKREWNGVLLIYPFPRGVVDDLHPLMPTVSLVEQYGTAPLDCVDVDHFKGIAMMINQLVAKGHRRIGFYTKNYEVEPSWSFRRFSAYAEKLVRMQKPLRESDIVNIYPNNFATLEESYDHVAKQTRDGVTAWVCAADHQAYDVITGLKARGFQIPHDVSVTGFDGIHTPEGAPGLATAVIPYREIGFTGAKRLHDLMRKRFVSPQHILVGCQSRLGQTIGEVLIGRNGNSERA